MTIKLFLLAGLCIIDVVGGYGQTGAHQYGRVDVEITKEKRPRNVYTTVVCTPAFPCNDSSWVQSLKDKLNQSVRANRKIKEGTYLVSVQFVVDKDCIIGDVRALTSNGYGMEAEVMRVLKKGAKWIPASQGIPVRPYRTSSSTPAGSPPGEA